MYRVREENYKSGSTRFIPEGYFEGSWINLGYESFGFNGNGLDWCSSFEEATNVLDRFKKSLAVGNDVLVGERIHEIK